MKIHVSNALNATGMEGSGYARRTFDLLHHLVKILPQLRVACDKHVHTILPYMLELLRGINGPLVQDAAF